jgi:uncharacterized 2Fe-2S/4Fe-4S cluster protein (DUF4445 family)
MFVKTKIIINEKELTVYSEQPGNLLEIIVQAGVAIDAPCAGLGRCGKCRVNVQGELPPDNVEMAILSNAEISTGTRLACRKRHIPRDLTITIPFEMEEQVKAAYGIVSEDIGVAVDLGTTSIVISFINLSDGTIMAMHSILNPQRIYGADVVSRIDAGLDALVLEKMTVLTVSAIAREIDKMLLQIGIDANRIKSTYIAGNTTMEHIISGTDVSSLAKAPYKPVFTSMRHVPYLKAKLGIASGDVVLFPIIGGFVGGDTVASILACGMDISDEIIALIDIGTNAEIAVGNKSGIRVSSAPAGPAFEGGQIKHGMRAQAGAIEDIRIINDELTLYVKGDTEPEGICGSGLIRIVAELVKAGVITKSGELLDAESIQNNLSLRVIKKDGEQAFVLYKSYDSEICLYQSDIRALQLAKASIATGLKLITGQTGLKPSRLYVAGAFGNYLNPDDLTFIGVIPSYLAGNTYFIGDSVISGLKRFIINEPAVDMDMLLSNIKHIELADDPSFNKEFLSMLELTPKMQ